MGTDADASTGEVLKCAKGHSHYKVPWTVYVLDPEQSNQTDTYRDALYPLDVFDTVEEVKNIYNLKPFAKPNGPPSWSLVVPQGTIAVFQGGKFGYPAVKPAWEDPATMNGGEFRFLFEKTNGLEVIDDIFRNLVSWMAGSFDYGDIRILGLFIKNVSKPKKPSKELQCRVWVSASRNPNTFKGVLWKIGKDMARKIADGGGRGRILYNYLSDMQNKAEKIETPEEPRFQLRIDVPFIDPKTQPSSWLPSGDRSHSLNSSGDTDISC